MNYTTSQASSNSGDNLWTSIVSDNSGTIASSSSVYMTIPFGFVFAGVRYTQLSVDSDGYVAFGNPTTVLSFPISSIPVATYNWPAIFGFAGNLSDLCNTAIFYKTFANKLVIQFDCREKSSIRFFSFQIILFSTGLIKILYNGYTDFSSVSGKIGIQASSTDGISISTATIGGGNYAVTFNSSGKLIPTITTPPTAVSQLVHGQTAASAGLSGGAANVPGTFAYATIENSRKPNAGTASAEVIFTPTDLAGYETVTIAVSITITKATPIVTKLPTASQLVYSLTLASCSLSPGTTNIATGVYRFETPTTVPAMGVSTHNVIFTPSSLTNYESVLLQVEVTVIKITSAVSSSPRATSIILGQTLADSQLSGGSARSLLTQATIPGSFSFQDPTIKPATAGTTFPTVIFTPTDQDIYNGFTVRNVSVAVEKLTPVISTFPTATTISFGQSVLSSTLSGGTAFVGTTQIAGRFAFYANYTPTEVGTFAYAVVFTPTDTTNYNSTSYIASSTADVTVVKASPVINASPTLSAINAGQALSASNISGGSALVGSTRIAGSFAFKNPDALLNIGVTSVQLIWTATEPAKYNSFNIWLNITVNKFVPTITTIPTATAIDYGANLSSSTLSGGVASVPGRFGFSNLSILPTVTAAQIVIFTPDDLTLYSIVQTSVTVTVLKKTPTILTLPTALSVRAGQTLSSATLSGGSASVPGSFVFKVTSDVVSAGISIKDVVFVPSNSNAFNNVNTTVNVTGNATLANYYKETIGYSNSGSNSWADLSVVNGAVNLQINDDGTQTETLGFSFPFYGINYTTVSINKNGYLNFGGSTEIAPNGVPASNVSVPAIFGYARDLDDALLGPSSYQKYSDKFIMSFKTAPYSSKGLPIIFQIVLHITGRIQILYNPYPNYSITKAIGVQANSSTGQSFNASLLIANAYNSITYDRLESTRTPTVNTQPTASSISIGQTLASSNLSGGVASVPGSFRFVSTDITPNVGSSNQRVIFIPDDKVNYDSTVIEVSVGVGKATPVIDVLPVGILVNYGSFVTYTVSLSGGSASVEGVRVPGEFAFENFQLVTSAGTSRQKVIFVPDVAANYESVAFFIDISVNRITPNITTTPTATAIVTGQPLSASALSGGIATVGGSFAFETPTATPIVGSSSQNVIFTPTDLLNYNSVKFTVNVTVNKATPRIDPKPTASDTNYGQIVADYSTLTGGKASHRGVQVFGSFAWKARRITDASDTAEQAVIFTPDDTSSFESVDFWVPLKINKLTPSITTEPTALDIYYGQALSNSVLSSSATATVAGRFAFTTPTIKPDIGSSTQSVTFTPTDTTNYNNVVIFITVRVVKATPTITALTASEITYGQLLSASSFLTKEAKVLGVTIPGVFTFKNPDTIPNSGTANQTVTFTPTDQVNYSNVDTSVSVKVNTASITIDTKPVARLITYPQTLLSSGLDGGKAVDSNGVEVAGTFSFINTSTVLNAGVTTVTAKFVPQNASYAGINNIQVEVTVSKATPTIVTAPVFSAITDGQALSDSLFVSGSASVAGVFTFTTPTTKPAIGTAKQNVTFTPTSQSNYNTITTLIDVTVNAKVTPDITTKPTASAIIYGQRLSSSQLSNTGRASYGGVSLSGSFAFEYPDTQPNLGTTSQSVKFTPTDLIRYNEAKILVEVTVNKITPSITVYPIATDIRIRQTLADSTLSNDGVASVQGTFAFTDPSIAPSVGTTLQSVTFTPNDSTYHNSVIIWVSVTIEKLRPNIFYQPIAENIVYGQMLKDSVLSYANTDQDGVFEFQYPETKPNAGTATHSVIFTPYDNVTYGKRLIYVDVTVNKAIAQIDIKPTGTDITYGQSLSSSQLSNNGRASYGGASLSGSFAWKTNGLPDAIDISEQTAVFIPTNDNYEIIDFLVYIKVNKAVPNIGTRPTASGIGYGQSLRDSKLSGGSASVAGSFEFEYPDTQPALGTTSQSIVFTATNPNYTTAKTTVSVRVDKATPIIFVKPVASTINDYQSLLNSTLTGGESFPKGSFVFTTPSTTPSIGVTEQSVTFTPNDTTNYHTISIFVSVTVKQSNQNNETDENSNQLDLINKLNLRNQLVYPTDQDLFYNRDRNISDNRGQTLKPLDNLSELLVSPVYGSRTEFTSTSFSYETNDSYFNTLPSSLNSLKANFKLRYDVDENDCRSLVNYFESKEGHDSFNFLVDGSGIYKELKGFCDNYAINHINNNHYEIAVDISVDQSPSFFNWTTSSFLRIDQKEKEKTAEPILNDDQYQLINKNWNAYEKTWGDYNLYLNLHASANSEYKKYDIEYFESYFDLVYGSYTWEEAKEDAKNRGGRLAIISTFAKSQMIPPHDQAMWIGGNDPERNNDFKWLDGSRVRDGYINWGESQPDNAGSSESCMQRLGVGYNYIWNNITSTANTYGISQFTTVGYVIEYLNTNKLNNYWYCTEDHILDYSNGPNINPVGANLLFDSFNIFTKNWKVGHDLGNFFSVKRSSIQAPNGSLEASEFTSTSETSGGLFLRAWQQMTPNKYSASIYIYMPTQAGVNSWSIVLDNDLDQAVSSEQILFDQWVKITIPINYSATRQFLDFNIRYNRGIAFGSSGFVIHAWFPVLTKVSSKWTQDFFFEPDIGFQNDVKLQVKKIEFKNSFPLRVKTKNNIAPLVMNYKFTSISDKQLKCMLHFLEMKHGYRKFRHQIESVYNRPKVFFSPQWSHTWKYYNAHDLEVSLVEDPLGIITKDT